MNIEVLVTENGETTPVPPTGTAGEIKNRQVEKITVQATFATGGDAVEYDSDLVVLNDLAGTPPTIAGVLLSRDIGDDLDVDAATEAIIAYAINRHVGNLLPTGASVNAFRTKPDEAVTVTLAERHAVPPAPA